MKANTFIFFFRLNILG